MVTAPRGTHPAPPPRPPARVPAPPALPTTTELLAGVRDYAEIAAREGQRDLTPAARKREKYVDASTREHGYAAYLEAWRRKVEAIGNLNYPAAARAQGLSGTLRMSVRVAADGSVGERRGAPFLGPTRCSTPPQRDIVRLAAPYAPFPDDIRKDTDVLVITRTWQFLDDTLRGQ